jgi:hypothetical protein
MRCRWAPAPWPPFWAWTPQGRRSLRRARPVQASGEVVEAVNFNDPSADRHCGQQGRRRKGLRSAQGGRAPSARCCCRCRRLFHSSLMKPAAERLREGWLHRPGRRRGFRSSTTSMWPSKSMPTASRCAVPPGVWPGALGRVCAGHQGPRASCTWSNAARARCWPGMVKRIDAELTGAAVYDPASLAEVKGAAAMRRHQFARPGGPGHRRFARHWCGHCAGTRARGLKVSAPPPPTPAPRHISRTAATRAAAAPAGRERRRRCRGAGGRDRQDPRRPAGAGQQRRHHARHAGHALKDDDWDAVLDTNLKAVFRHEPRRDAHHDEAALRPHHQHHQRGGRFRQPGPGQLRGGQGRRGRHDAGAGA